MTRCLLVKTCSYDQIRPIWGSECISNVLGEAAQRGKYSNIEGEITIGLGAWCLAFVLYMTRGFARFTILKSDLSGLLVNEFM